jgi:putative colanic acid biosynthesis acetyltransferase WcaF
MRGKAPESAIGPSRGDVPDRVSLARFSSVGFHRGRPAIVEALWIVVQALLVASFLPGSAHRRFLLRLFGAQIGRRVTIKPGVRVKFPWRLAIADDVWIGEDVWIDNLASVQIGTNVCVSQGAYLCTGSHNWSAATFDLITRPIRIESGSWIAAKAIVGPGVTVGSGAILTLGSMASSDLEPWTICGGTPARLIRPRKLSVPNDPCAVASK